MMRPGNVPGLAVLPLVMLLRPSVGRVADDYWDNPVRDVSREATVSVEQVTLQDAFGGALPERRNSVCGNAVLFLSSFLGAPPEVINPGSRHVTHSYCRGPHCGE